MKNTAQSVEDFAHRGAQAQAAVDRVIAEQNERHRQSRVINRDYVRKWALDYAHDKRFARFTRVSERFLDAIEAATKREIRIRVDKHPSRGMTLT